MPVGNNSTCGRPLINRIYLGGWRSRLRKAYVAAGNGWHALPQAFPIQKGAP